VNKNFAEMVGSLDIEELIRVKKDLDNGGNSVARIVNEKLKERARRDDSYCCVCSSKIDPFSVSKFTLVFGPDDMNKRASFCAIDCMEHFIKNLKEFWVEENQTFIRRKKNEN
jgi:hypothetical protein